MAQLNNTTEVVRDPPTPRSFSKAFWDAAREKRLLLQYDPRNKKYQFIPRPTSVYDGRRQLEWREASGRGEIFSFLIASHANPPFRGHTPFAIALVTLLEGVNIMANVVNCEVNELRIGLPVNLTWLPLTNGAFLPAFEPEKT
jgi:uncharacterized OB-fold protein